MVALRNIFAIALAGLMLALSAPAMADMQSDGSQFLKAVKEKDSAKATEMLNSAGSTVIRASDITTGETCLHITIAERNLLWTRWLLQEGAEANAADRRGVTPLLLAISIGYMEGVAALVDGGANVDVASTTGETPLIAAVHTGNLELMEILLKAGADPDRTDNAGRSARMYASERRAGRALAVIEEHGRPAAQRASGTRVYGPSF